MKRGRGAEIKGFCLFNSSLIQEGFPNDIFQKDGRERRQERREEMGREKEGGRGGKEVPTMPLRMIGSPPPWVHSCHQVLWRKTGRLPISVCCSASILVFCGHREAVILALALSLNW